MSQTTTGPLAWSPPGAPPTLSRLARHFTALLSTPITDYRLQG